MVHRITFVLLAVLACAAWAAGQAPAPTPAAKPVAKAPAGAGMALPYRKLAPDVMEPIDPQQERATYSVHTVTELAQFPWAQDVIFRGDVWVLDFQFKPVRMMWIDIPGPHERMQRKLIWYLLYSVTNPGKVFHPVQEEGGTYKVEQVDRPLRFIPSFTMEAHSRLQDEAAGFAKVYHERCIPLAMAAVRGREDPHRKFLSTFEMPEKEIGVGETVWGIATWEDIDPRTVWFSIYLEGLTNAYHWKDDTSKSAEIQLRSTGQYRTVFTKMLKLNFWRPGDEFSVKENQIRLGVPGPNGKPGLPQYEWVWRRAF
jgi:hypothetical protein